MDRNYNFPQMLLKTVNDLNKEEINEIFDNINNQINTCYNKLFISNDINADLLPVYFKVNHMNHFINVIKSLTIDKILYIARNNVGEELKLNITELSKSIYNNYVNMLIHNNINIIDNLFYNNVIKNSLLFIENPNAINIMYKNIHLLTKLENII